MHMAYCKWTIRYGRKIKCIQFIFGRKAYHLAAVKWEFPIGNRMESARRDSMFHAVLVGFFFDAHIYNESNRSAHVSETKIQNANSLISF